MIMTDQFVHIEVSFNPFPFGPRKATISRYLFGPRYFSHLDVLANT